MQQRHSEVENLLRDKGGFLVEIDGFDEMMNEVRRVVEFDVKKMLGSIEERRNQIIKHLEKFEPQYSEDILGEIVEAAKEPTEKVREDKKISALDFVLRGNKAYEGNDFFEAEKLYRRAIELNPNNALAHNNLGNVLRDLKRHDEAEAMYRRAIELNPNNALAHNNLGNALRDLKRHDEAEAMYRRAIELDPKYYDAYGNLIVLLRLLDREREAIVIAESVKNLDFHSPIFLLSLAALYKKLGNKTAFEQYAAQTRELFEACAN